MSRIISKISSYQISSEHHFHPELLKKQNGNGYNKIVER